MTNPRTAYHSIHKEEIKRIDNNEIISTLEKAFNLSYEDDPKTFAFTVKNMIKNERLLSHMALDVFHLPGTKDLIRLLVYALPEIFNFHLINFIKDKKPRNSNSKKTKIDKKQKGE